MAIKAILFDKDGVLVDFDATFGPVTNKVLDLLCDGDETRKREAAEIMDFDIGASRFRNTAFLIAGTSLDMAAHVGSIFDRSDHHQFAMEIDRHYGELCAEVVVAISGAGEALSALSQTGFILGIATNDAEANARSQMDRLQMTGHFATIMGADSGHGPKPEPGMIHAFMDVHSVSPHEIIMVGDSTHDMAAARAGGVMGIAVESGPATRAELEPHAHVVLSSIAELPAWLATGRSM